MNTKYESNSKQQPSWLQRLVRRAFKDAPPPPAPPPEIRVGQLWGRAWDTGNPFANWFSIIEDVRDGWVKYRATTPDDGYVSRSYDAKTEEKFREMHSKPIIPPNAGSEPPRSNT